MSCLCQLALAGCGQAHCQFAAFLSLWGSELLSDPLRLSTLNSSSFSAHSSLSQMFGEVSCLD